MTQLRKAGALAAVAAIIALPAQASATPSTQPMPPFPHPAPVPVQVPQQQPQVPQQIPQRPQGPTVVQAPTPAYTPPPQVNPPHTYAPNPPTHTYNQGPEPGYSTAPHTAAPDTPRPGTTAPGANIPTEGPVPTGHTNVPTDGPLPGTSPGVNIPTDRPIPSSYPAPSVDTRGPAVPSSAGVTTLAPVSPPPSGSNGPFAGTNSNPHLSAPNGHQQVVLPGTGGSTTTVPLAAPAAGVPAARESVQAARVSPPAQFDAATPPPPPSSVNFNQQLQNAIHSNVDNGAGTYQPRHWDYVDYDEYHRPSIFNPLSSDMTFKYFYDGIYHTVFVPVGGRVLLDAAVAGVFPFTVAAGEVVSAGSFLGGAWIPPLDWVGPPPVDYVPWTPTEYDTVACYFPAVDQTVAVDRITMVGHDETAPPGSQDTFLLNGTTLARGEVQPAPPGSPPQVTVRGTQSMPGVSPWSNGQDWVNTAVQRPSASHNRLPWILGGIGAIVAALAGVALWVWRHPHGGHAGAAAAANVPTVWLDQP